MDASQLRTVTGHRTADEVVAGLEQGGVGDGLPYRQPTASRVSAMLAGRDPSEPIPPLPPLASPVTAEDAASCAVLAGCPPGILGHLLAALQAIAEPEFNLLGVTTTTGNAAVGAVLHGPGARRHGAAAGANCLGGSPVNAPFGRALALACRVLGGAVPGVLDMATLGQPAKIALCLPEAESPPGWEGLAAARGLDPSADAVTVFCAAGTLEVADTSSGTGQELLETLAAATPLPAAVSADGALLGGGQQLYVLPPEWVAILVADGWTRDRMGEFLFEHAVLSPDRLPGSGSSRLSAPAQVEPIRSARSPEDFLFACAGGAGIKAAYLPSWPGGSLAVTRPVA